MLQRPHHILLCFFSRNGIRDILSQAISTEADFFTLIGFFFTHDGFNDLAAELSLLCKAVHFDCLCQRRRGIVVYRYMLRPDLYYIAYKNLYANNGAATEGVNSDTADGFSEEKITKIIDSLRNESYQPKPSRRTYRKKANGKMRPLGIPTFTDKLVQEVLRMILEAVYEPVFMDCSHGFRPNRSCHTALKDLKHQFHGTRWFIEGDIKGCFDNIDHQTLIGVIGKKVKDARLHKLIWKFLKAGYMEEWEYRSTYSGTPQGGIISPLFANIYLNELDKYISTLAENFEKPGDIICTPEYGAIKRQRLKLSEAIKCATEPERAELLRQYKVLMKADHQSKQFRLEDSLLKYYPEKIEESKGFIRGLEADRQTLAAHPLPAEGFIGMEIRGDALTDKENAGAALLDACKEVKGMNPVEIGHYRGLTMSVAFDAFEKAHILTLKGEMSHRVILGADVRGNLTRIENALEKIPDQLRAVQAQLDNLYQQQAAAQAEVGKPFPYEQELSTKMARLIELDMQLNLDGKNRPQQEQVIAKSEKPSVLERLKTVPVCGAQGKPHKNDLEVR